MIMQLGGEIVKLFMLCYNKQKKINVKSKKTEIYQEKQTLVTSKHPLQKSKLIMEMKHQFIL